MKKRSITILAGLLLVAMLLLALVACNNPGSYELSETNITLNVEEDRQLTISPTPQSVTWDSDNKEVATVANGLVHAVSAGTAKITATIEGESEPLTCTVTVIEDVNGYRFEVASITVKTSENHPLKIINDQGESPTSVTYTSDDPTIATVTAAGVVEGVKVGKTTIRAKLTGGTLTCKVEVLQKYTYTLDKTSLDLAVGATDTLTLITTPSGGTSRPHTFLSSDPTIVEVTNAGTGKIEAKSKGTATITCLVDGTEEASATVTVREYTIMLGERELEDNGTMAVDLNDEYNITITADPAPSSIEAHYDSSNHDIVSVDGTGHVIVKAYGQATITITVGGKDFTSTLVAEEYFAPAATVTTPTSTPLTSGTINLSTVGNVDWAYVDNGGNGVARKAGVSGIIGDVGSIQYQGGDGGANLDPPFGSFTWYTLDATAAAAGGSVNNFHWANEWYDIPVHLPTGTYTVTLYLSGWKNSYFVSVIDSHENIIVDKFQAVEGNKSSSQAVAVQVTLTVTTEDDFTFRMTKDGEGNHGWAAIAVSNELSFTINEYEYELELGNKETDTIAITGGTSLTYVSADTGIATVNESGLITAKGVGATYITISDGTASHRVFVTVMAPARFEEEQLTLTSGGQHHQLTVYDGNGNPVADTELTFATSNRYVAEVSDDGIITPHAIGKATITITYGPKTFICELTVTSTSAELIDTTWSVENLSTASKQYKTIDYKHWFNEEGDKTVSMPSGAGLIGEPTGMGGGFWDYKGSIAYQFDSDGQSHNLGRDYGRVCNDNFTIQITLNANVTGIVFYTGAYHGIGVVEFKIGDKTLATSAFKADQGIARKIVVNITDEDRSAGNTLVIAGRVEEKGDGANVNVVAVAVIGNVEHSLSATGSVTKIDLGNSRDNQGINPVDLTAEGTYDWIYSQWGGDDGYHKINGHNVFHNMEYYNEQGQSRDAGNGWGGGSAFKWSDGVRNTTNGQEGSNNPVDGDESWNGHNEMTNNFKLANGEIRIGMNLEVGTYTIKLYLDSWRAAMAAGIYDGNKNFIVGEVCSADEPGGGAGYVLTFELTVTKADDFTIVISKIRSVGDAGREVGWQAVTISKFGDQVAE